MRQFISTIPTQCIDAARIDGAGEFAIFRRIILPMSKSSIVTLIILASLGSWDQFLWPLIVVSDQDLATMPLGISYLRSVYECPSNSLLAISVVMTLPILIIFIVFQRKIMESTATTGIKG